jgi:hypothetical protein
LSSTPTGHERLTGIIAGTAARNSDGATDPPAGSRRNPVTGRKANRECLYRLNTHGSLFAIDTNLGLSNELSPGRPIDGRSTTSTLSRIIWKREY